MSKQRYINTKFWSDTWIAELDPIEKLLFIYLLSNEHTEICGAYELPLKYMALETGIDKEMIVKILDRFEKDDKVMYRDGWVAIRNFIKNQSTNSPKVKIGIEMSINRVPKRIIDLLSIPSPYPIHTPSHSNSNSNSNPKSGNLSSKTTVNPKKSKTVTEGKAELYKKMGWSE